MCRIVLPILYLERNKRLKIKIIVNNKATIAYCLEIQNNIKANIFVFFLIYNNEINKRECGLGIFKIQYNKWATEI